MSYNKEIPDEQLNEMTDTEQNKYWRGQELNALRDKFAIAALTGLISNANWINNIDDTADDAYVIADAMMLERSK